ncbi:MAG: hypothetical protein M1828_004897 [Chrysothrix sp. TS-e1954]|nr:MAG: hypothetical protein M1828_004897 [Chrysothrix sp. TS-e1954]
MATPNQMSATVNSTREHVQGMVTQYQNLLRSGRPENDPEVLKLRNYLTNARKQNDLQRQRMLYQQQQQQHGRMEQQSHQSNGLQNGASTQTHANGFVPSAPVVGSPFEALENGSAPESTAPLTGTSSSSSLSEDMKMMLRNQMLAFKMLSKDAPIPIDVQRAVFPSQQDRSSPGSVKDARGAQTHSLGAGPEVEENGEMQNPTPKPPQRVFTDYAVPSDLFRAPIKFSDHDSLRWGKQGQRRLFVPSMMPSGVDAERVREERETIIYNRIKARRTQLEHLPASLSTWDSGKSDVVSPDSSLKLKALIEYKKLYLLPKQTLLRQQISHEMMDANNLAMTADRARYRRQKKQKFLEARITEKLEKQQRDARESKEKKKHSDYMQSLLQHADEVHRQAREQKARTQRLGRMMQQQHQTIEKEEQKRVERTAKQRLQALKANDEETYLKLLGQAKDSRISHLLKQTDGFLNQLAASVKSQQRHSAKKFANQGALPPEDEESEEEEDEEDSGKKVDYYEVAHRKKEEVKEQSSNLVGGSLKEYQLKGLQWMISLFNNNLNGILADEMGLGKTIQTISLIGYLIEKKKKTGPFLVIVPLSTLTNWNNEFEKWAPSVNRIVYKGPPNSRKQAANQIRSQNFNVLLTTYEFIIKDRPLLSKVKWLHMVVDEGHRMKNAGSKLSVTITQYYQSQYRLILTGTPLQNNLPELWALLNFVLPTIFKSVKSFDEWFNTPFANTGGQDKMDLNEEEQILVIRRLHKVLRPFLLRRLKVDVEKDLPDKQERVIKCTFSSLQAKLYKQLKNNNKLMVSDGKGGKTGVRGLSNMLMQLRKLCNHPYVFEEVENQINPMGLTNDDIWRVAGKFELLDRILPKFKATGHRILMFFQMTQIMNIMEDYMRYRQFQYLRLDGSTKSDERADLLKDFNAEGSPYFVFLLSTRAGGLGLNLQTADTVVIFDSDWNPFQDLQAQDRAHRIGQKNEVRILRLISSNSIEEKILERAQFKLDMDGKVIQAGKFDNKSSNEDRDAMLRVMLETVNEGDDLETEEMDDDDLNMLMMRSEDELVVFQKLDEERANDPRYGPGKKLQRLMGESELPEIYVNEDVGNPEADLEEINFGRGARERTRVKYDDGLTEEQWLEAVDNDEDTIEAAVARKDAKLARRTANKEKRLRAETGDIADTPPAASRASTDSPAPTTKKRGRKGGPGRSGADKRKVSDAALDSESVTPAAAPPRKRGRQSKPAETLSSNERAAVQRVLDVVYEAIDDLVVPTDDPEFAERAVIEPFIELPPKAHFADYYQLIQEPICMEHMQKRINRKEYQSLDGFAKDIRLMCLNAQTYNEDSSFLFTDSQLIEERTMQFLREQSDKNPDLGRAAFTLDGKGGTTTHGRPSTGDPSNSNSTTASAAASGPGTPVHSGGTKLKLHMGNGHRD